MTKTEIFEEIVTIMADDSATKKDIAGANPDSYRQKIRDEMTDEDFYYQVKSYLASFGVISHVGITPKDFTRTGFQLRRFGDGLYMTDCLPSTGLKKGDKITHLDGETIAQVYSKHKNFFVSQKEERQWMEWGYFVQRSEEVTLERDGQPLTTSISAPSPTESYGPAFDGHYIHQDTYYLKMENFSDEAALATLYEKALPELAKVDNLIIDVRVNHGGTDSLFLPLLPYVLPAEKTMKDIPSDDDFGMEMLYTDRNVETRLSVFRHSLSQEGVTEETRQMLKSMMADLERYRGQGYVIYKEDDDGEFWSAYVGQKAAPKRVYVLSDVTCGSSGDNFVLMMKNMPKVTVVGRPTLGILDYSNCAEVDFGKWQMIYPTSRWLAIDAGKGMNDIGVLPHIELPWSPASLKEDMDLQYVLSAIAQEKATSTNQ